MKKYLVIAVRWSDEEKAQVKYVAGEFPTYTNASIFRNAYNEFYQANAIVVEVAG